MLRVILSVAVVCMVISLFFPEELLRIYTADTAVIEKGAIYLRYSTASFVMMAITMTLTLILRSIHDVKIPLYASIGSFFVNIFLTGSLFWSLWCATDADCRCRNRNRSCPSV